ncbi:MAG: ArsR/SmtB family transcription factor [Bordetella sp.]|uniref:ArsR/SmtB family transcription factor n=1 Tax=Bordetella sp. TaxID=28081 RepID=UPI003F7B999C
MLSTASLAETAALIGDLARASMLAALMDGRALTAAELAQLAGISPQTASGHLAKLTQAGLLSVEKQGRHRYHRLASPSVAHMLEHIMSVSVEREAGSQARGPRVVTGPRDKALRYARTCYDHLAGEIAVAITDSMIAAGHIELTPEAGALTEQGTRFLHDLGIEPEACAQHAAPRRSTRVFCRPCLDWSERRHHIAGTLGAALFQHYLKQGWIRRPEGTRSVTVTPAGQQAFARLFGVRP